MSFPTTSILDTFNRPDEGPPPTGWASPILNGLAGFRIVSNHLINNVAGSNTADGYWTATTFGPDTECYVTIVSGASGGIGLYIRGQQPGTGGFDGYYADIYPSTIDFYRLDNDQFASLGSVGTTVLDGDSFGLGMVGSLLTAYRKPSGGAWGSVGSVSDSTYTGAGYIGVLLSISGAVNLDDFGGGTIVIGGGGGVIDSRDRGIARGIARGIFQ